ncbi:OLIGOPEPTIDE TRANSPORTER-RELATED [Salix viminalis]|uniref:OLIGOPEPTIDE TRANSPORTER-RELATED n=1 Tax=Salix viminalis TaxID=40686 RepID=A0A9Q0U1P5_SALVM|nr:OLIGOPEPTIDE TRANSPORTER-RELATED [Salix viminalis]
MEMELQEQQLTRWEGYVDWRNRPALRGRHGGMLAASFVLGVEILENLAYLANASNLVMYLSEYMHLSPSKSANSVTNFMGTSFLLALLGGFLTDTFFTTYHVFLISAAIEFLGLVILTVQARSSSLKPPACNASNVPTIPCQEIDGAKAAMLFTGLYLVALGVGGIKGSLPAHGAEQFDESSPQGRKQRSTFFNYFVFCLSCGALFAVTFVVWVEDNKGWVLVAAGFNSCMSTSSSNAIASLTTSPSNPAPAGKDAIDNSTAAVPAETPTKSLDWLNKAVVNKPIHSTLECTVQQVEDVKIVIKIFPIFACTIMLNCCLAQLSTFSVQQADTMDTKLGSLKVPPASLPVFPVVFIMMLAPVYDHLIIPFARKLTKSEMGITCLKRIGIGLVLSIVAMAVAALVEIKRKRVATDSGLAGKLPITFFWIAFQYLFLGSADLFTLAGLLEFFFTEAPAGMRSLAMSLSWASLAMGYYLSSVIVSIVNNVTGNSKNRPWLSGTNLNHYHLERFYWLLCVLSVLNFLHYLFWATRYKYSARVKN